MTAAAVCSKCGNSSSELPWLIEARKFIGLQEIKGADHAPEILDMWKKIRRGGIKSDEVPWCSAFVGACFETVGILSTRFEGASSWLNWGDLIDEPQYGCVVVFKRNGGFHVGFLMGYDYAGNLMILGGNQGDMVSIKPFKKDRVAGYRSPRHWNLKSLYIPTISSNSPLSIDES